jgi:hypothetical protein
MKFFGGSVGPRGTLALQHVPAVPFPQPGMRGLLATIARGLPVARGLSWRVFAWRVKNLPNLWRGSWRALLGVVLGVPFVYGVLHLRLKRADGTIIDYGVASLRVITTTGAGYIVDAFQNLVESENMKFHGLGTGATGEAVGDTALQTELTTQYNPDNTRATGSLTEGASANIFRTVGTNTVDAAAAVTEHGILSQAATGGGVLLDRSVFSVVNLANGDSLQSTYDLTINTGG